MEQLVGKAVFSNSGTQPIQAPKITREPNIMTLIKTSIGETCIKNNLDIDSFKQVSADYVDGQLVIKLK